MKKISSRELGNKICETLGLPPQHVKSVSIKCEAGEAAIVVMERFVVEEELPRLIELIVPLSAEKRAIE